MTREQLLEQVERSRRYLLTLPLWKQQWLRESFENRTGTNSVARTPVISEPSEPDDGDCY